MWREKARRCNLPLSAGKCHEVAQGGAFTGGRGPPRHLARGSLDAPAEGYRDACAPGVRARRPGCHHQMSPVAPPWQVDPLWQHCSADFVVRSHGVTSDKRHRRHGSHHDRSHPARRDTVATLVRRRARLVPQGCVRPPPPYVHIGRLHAPRRPKVAVSRVPFVRCVHGRLLGESGSPGDQASMVGALVSAPRRSRHARPVAGRGPAACITGRSDTGARSRVQSPDPLVSHQRK